MKVLPAGLDSGHASCYGQQPACSPPERLLGVQALQDCQGRLKGLVQGMEAMQTELAELQAKHHSKTPESEPSGTLSAVHSATAR